jgi:hypothetical protein
MKRIIPISFVIILALAIGFSPSVSVGQIAGDRQIEIRLEDILIAVFGLIFLIKLFRARKLERPPFLTLIVLWLSIGFVSVLTNWIFSDLALSRGFFYFLKEIEFFAFYFYVFWGVKAKDELKLVTYFWLAAAFLNMLYVFYQIVIGSRQGEYGTAAIAEWGVFPTGGFFSIMFIFLFNIFLYYFLNLNISVFKKAGLGILSFLPLFGVLGSLSQTVILGTLMALLLTIVFYFLKSKDVGVFFILISVFIIISIVFLYFAIKDVSYFDRITKISSFDKIISLFLRKRWNDVIVPMFSDFVNNLSLKDLLIGKGIGAIHEAHNQFLRNLMQTGLIGSAIFIFLIISLLKAGIAGFLKNTDNLKTGFLAGFLISTLAMLFFSMATEPFIVVKPAEVYWFFTGLTMAVSTKL